MDKFLVCVKFLFDDPLGLDTVEQFCKGGFNMLAYVASHHQKEQVVARFEQPFFGLGDNGKDSGLFFHFAADGSHLGRVV